MEKKLMRISGGLADAGEFDSSGLLVAKVKGGPHNGHTVEIDSDKHNCGAYGEAVTCSCGAYWQSAMHGCWQQGHQREEEGDTELAKMTTLEYDLVG